MFLIKKVKIMINNKFESLAVFDGPKSKYMCLLTEEKGAYSSLHRHEYYEITYFTSGEGTAFINGKEYRCIRGSFYILSPEDTHAHYNKNSASMRICALKRDISLKNLYLWNGLFGTVVNLPENDQLRVNNLFQSIDDELFFKKNLYDNVAESYMDVILAIVYRNCKKSDEKDTEWDKLIDYLNHNYQQVTLSEAADYLSVTKEHFCRLFKKKYGITLGDYLKRLKVQRAQELLLNTDQNILDISVSLGYASPGKFFKDFKRFTDLTPAQFRKKNI